MSDETGALTGTADQSVDFEDVLFHIEERLTLVHSGANDLFDETSRTKSDSQDRRNADDRIVKLAYAIRNAIEEVMDAIAKALSVD